MTNNALPIHRTRRISLTKTQLRTDEGAELLRLCESIVADGQIEQDEWTELCRWIEDRGQSELPAVSYLREMISRTKDEGQEEQELYRELYRAVERVLPPEVRQNAVAARRRREVVLREAAKLERERAAAEERERRLRDTPFEAANFMVAGVRFEGRPSLIRRQARVDDSVELVRDPWNQYSPYAIQVRLESGAHIGYVPEEDAEILAPLLDEGARFEAHITKILSGRYGPIPVVQVYLFKPDSTVGTIARRLEEAKPVSIAPPLDLDAPKKAIPWRWVISLLIIGYFVALANGC